MLKVICLLIFCVQALAKSKQEKGRALQCLNWSLRSKPLLLYGGQLIELRTWFSQLIASCLVTIKTQNSCLHVQYYSLYTLLPFSNCWSIYLLGVNYPATARPTVSPLSLHDSAYGLALPARFGLWIRSPYSHPLPIALHPLQHLSLTT